MEVIRIIRIRFSILKMKLYSLLDQPFYCLWYELPNGDLNGSWGGQLKFWINQGRDLTPGGCFCQSQTKTLLICDWLKFGLIYFLNIPLHFFKGSCRIWFNRYWEEAIVCELQATQGGTTKSERARSWTGIYTQTDTASEHVCICKTDENSSVFLGLSEVFSIFYSESWTNKIDCGLWLRLILTTLSTRDPLVDSGSALVKLFSIFSIYYGEEIFLFYSILERTCKLIILIVGAWRTVGQYDRGLPLWNPSKQTEVISLLKLTQPYYTQQVRKLYCS